MASTVESDYIQLGPRKWQLGSEYLKRLEPDNECLNSLDIGQSVRNILHEKGYIYLKHFLPREDVLKAKLAG